MLHLKVNINRESGREEITNVFLRFLFRVFCFSSIELSNFQQFNKKSREEKPVRYRLFPFADARHMLFNLFRYSFFFVSSINEHNRKAANGITLHQHSAGTKEFQSQWCMLRTRLPIYAYYTFQGIVNWSHASTKSRATTKQLRFNRISCCAKQLGNVQKCSHVKHEFFSLFRSLALLIKVSLEISNNWEIYI